MIVALVAFLAIAVPMARWLRVAQREHYLPGRISRISLLWFTAHAARTAAHVALVVALAVVLVVLDAPAVLAVLPLSVAVLAPLGLRWRGPERPLAWTTRVKRLAVVHGVLGLVVGAVLGLLVPDRFAPVVALLALASAAFVDLSLAVTKPLERRLAQKFVTSAAERLRRTSPRVLAITGSFGKTSTKNYVRHLVAGTLHIEATPASFNNLMGLSKAINAGLVPGTQAYVAEMGTYGPGEIRELTRWFPPEISCITSIGDVHLERMKSRAGIVTAKSEVFQGARVAVLNVDYPELDELAGRLSGHEQLVRVSSDPARTDADVLLHPDAADPGTLVITAHGASERTAMPGDDVRLGNLGCAVAMALALDVPLATIAGRVGSLPEIPHRSTTGTLPSGTVVVDDTFNSNPPGAAAALASSLALATERGGSLWVVTPGMIELGPVQREANTTFARAVTDAGATLVTVGRTNLAALRAGADAAAFRSVATRATAVHMVGAEAGERDVILYENDLPDHYP